jgi:hypothetical protein
MMADTSEGSTVLHRHLSVQIATGLVSQRSFAVKWIKHELTLRRL